MNVPNLLTITRFALIPIYLIVFYYDHIITAFFIVVLAGFTDIMDGYLARKRQQVTELGIMLDPLADKLMMITVILSLLLARMIPWQAAALFFIRDIGMIVGSAFFHIRGKRTVPANTMGKLTTVLFYIAFALIFFRADFAVSFLWFVIGFACVTSVIYIVLFKALNKSRS